MREAMTFGEYLTEIMRKKRISVADLARRLNYRSRTSLSRLMRDETRFDSIEDFMQRLEPVSAWLLTAEEMQQLKRTMEVSRLGRARYKAYEEIWRLIAAPTRSAQAPELECFGSGTSRTLQDLAQEWKRAQSMQAYIVNSGSEVLFEQFAELLAERPDADIRIYHYLLVHDAPGVMAQQLGAMMEIFHDPRYQGCYRTWNSEGTLVNNGIQNNLAVISGRREDGSEFMQLLVIHEEGKSLLYENDHAENLAAFARRALDRFVGDALPLKTEYPEQQVADGLLAICRRYLNCEKDRAICCLAPSVCFELIPCRILKPVMLDSALRGCDESDPMVSELIRIHCARYENIAKKKKKTVFMFTWEGLRRFAHTGYSTDHVVGMRPFTPKERIGILQDVLEQVRSNVYLNVYIMHPEIKVRGMTLTTHEGIGVYLLDSNTQYDVVNGHSEAFILMPDFAATLAGFFRDELIEKHAFSEAESMEMLRGLIASIKE
jgi:transcriptional regulator with XRE-family HTH domain